MAVSDNKLADTADKILIGKADDFLKEQLAGDLLPAKGADDRAENLVATAYLALGPKSQNAQNRVQFAFDVADEQIDAVGRKGKAIYERENAA